MINVDDVIKEEKKEYNPNWPEIPDHSCRILIIGGSGLGKINSLFNVVDLDIVSINIDKIYLCTKDF